MPSTSLKDIAYDAAQRTLEVTFIANGRRYRYFDVSLAEYEALRSAFSKGVWFNAHIKPTHGFEPVSERSSA
jgi:KTSC domain-containing protein